MKTSSQTKKRAAAIVAVLALFTTVLGGTYAWKDYKQHKSNPLKDGMYKYEVVLVEDFDERDDWKVSDGEITKEISVKNTGIAANGFKDVYVRIQLKEYMSIVPMIFEETPERYMIDIAGEFIYYKCGTASPANEAAALDYFRGRPEITERKDSLPPRTLDASDITFLTNAVNGESGYYLKTKEHDPNGQYGKYVITRYDLDESQMELVTPGITYAGDDVNKSKKHDVAANGVAPNRNGECDYLKRLWDGTENPTEAYIEWLLNTGSIVLLSDWDGEPVDKWIIDDTAGLDDAWIYWGQALPCGEQTANFLNAVQLIEQPNGSFYYVIHTELEAVSLDELTSGNVNWGDVGDSFIKSAFVPAESVKIKGGNVEMTVGETYTPGCAITPSNSTDKAKWTSGDPNVATVNEKTGKITAAGEGEVTITVTVGDKTDTITITVIPAAPSTELPVNTPQGGFTPITHEDPENGDGWYGQINHSTGIHNEIQKGALHLEDIITDGNYNGVTVTAVDPKFAPHITIGACGRHDNKPSILYDYLPTNEECWDWALTYGNSDIVVTIQVELTRDDGKSAIITLNMIYPDCQITLD